MAQTIRHFLPDLNAWIDEIEDPRFLPMVTYHKRFLVWWGLMLFLAKLGSRRQLDFQLCAAHAGVLANLNRLAGTHQETRPVNGTLEHFLGGIGSVPLADLRQKAVNRLIRMKALDEARLQGRFVILIDATGFLVFHEKHCKDCLKQKVGEKTVYLHQTAEAKLLGPAGTVFSIATEFIDNRDVKEIPAGSSFEEIKQDCELKALGRMLPKLRAVFPQLRICLSSDSLYACGSGLELAKKYNCDYVYVFKEGRTPALWREFQELLKLCPEHRVEWTTPEQTHQVYRWVPLEYTDSEGREWRFTGIECKQIDKKGAEGRWAWITSLEVNAKTVVEVATQGGRQRWRIENEGFNTQKNSGLNLEHAYSHKNWEAYYFLLQLAHLILQLMEKGSLLLHLARELDCSTAVKLFGSLKNMAQRLLDSVRYLHWPDEAFDVAAARKIQIRLNDSS